MLFLADCAFSKRTVIAGNEGCNFRYGSINKPSITSTCPGRLGLADDAVALVFVRDKSKLNGTTFTLWNSEINS